MAKKTDLKTTTKQPSISELVKLTDKENPAPEHLKAIRQHMDENNELVKLNEIGERAIKGVISNYTASALMKEVYVRQMHEKRAEMGYDSANTMEQMLINQVVLCHLRMSMVEMYQAEKVKASHTIETGMYWDRLLTTYQRRFQRACESLAKVKKLLAESNYHDQRARKARSSSTKNSLSILKMMTKKADRNPMESEN